MQFTHDGETWVFRGEYRRPKRGDYYLADMGSILQATCPNKEYHRIRAIVLKASQAPQPGEKGK